MKITATLYIQNDFFKLIFLFQTIKKINIYNQIIQNYNSGKCNRNNDTYLLSLVSPTQICNMSNMFYGITNICC